MQPETELLVLCASPARTAQNHARIGELVEGPIDWALLHERADAHRLIPLLYTTLQELRPADVSASLAADFRDSARKSLLLTAELIRVLDLLQSEGIEALPFKGPALAIAAFDNLALRSFDDLDILVHRSDVWRARDVLLRAEYDETVELSSAREEDLLNSYDELVLRGSKGFPLLELHWSFLAPHYSVPLNPDVFWNRAGSISVGSRSIPSLNAEDLTVFLCLHGAKHCWSRLSLLSDIGWLISRHEIDWKTVLSTARELRVLRIVLVAIALVNRIFGVPIPEPLNEACRRDERVAGLANETVTILFGEGHDESAIFASGRLYVRMRESGRDKLAYMFGLANRPGIEDWQAIDLPARWNFLYRFVRFPRIIWKYLRT
jgi:hypothetical protein